MTILDWVLVAVITFHFVRGLFRGFLLELADIIAIIGGYLVARNFGPRIALLLSDHTPLNSFVAGIIAAVVLFFLVLVIVGLCARLLKKLTSAAAMGWIDRVAGCILATLKSLLVLVVLMVIFSFIPVGEKARAYVVKGQVSGLIWLGSGYILDNIRVLPTAPSRLMASYLRSYGLSEEVVHLVTDRPELMQELIRTAPPEAKLPVKDILSGKPATEMPKRLNMPRSVSHGMVEAFENDKLTDKQKAEIFWTLVDKASD